MYSARREASTRSAGGCQSCSGPVEVIGIVRADEYDLLAMAAGQLAQAFLIGDPLLAVGVVEILEDPQAGRAVGGRGELVVVEVGVAAVQQPSVAGSQRHSRVPARVAGERHQEHLVA